MIKNFPPRYFFIFTDNPEIEIHRNRVIGGLRVALTLLMEEFDIYILLLQESVTVAKKQELQESRDTQDSEDIHFTPYELMDGLISFGAKVMTCKSSLTIANMHRSDLIDGVEILTLHTALMKMNDCDKVLTF